MAQIQEGVDLVHGEGLNAPRNSGKVRDRNERLTNTGMEARIRIRFAPEE